MALIKYLEWDSDFFGYKVGEINIVNSNLPQLLIDAKNNNYKLLYCRISPDQIIENEICLVNNGKFVDCKTTFSRDTPSDIDLTDHDTFFYENDFVTEDILNLTLQSGIHSRFKVDLNFVNDEFTNLYTVWINRSIRKEKAHKIIVHKGNEKILGFLTLVTNGDTSEIGLIAVDEKHRGSGIGSKIVSKFISESINLNKKKLKVVTQKANINACFFYTKLGFQIEKEENIYHFWF